MTIPVLGSPASRRKFASIASTLAEAGRICLNIRRRRPSRDVAAKLGAALAVRHAASKARAVTGGAPALLPMQS